MKKYQGMRKEQEGIPKSGKEQYRIARDVKKWEEILKNGKEQ